MSWLNKLPGFVRSAAGWEWALWKRLPLITLAGTIVPALVGLLAALWWPESPWRPDGSWAPGFLQLTFALVGLVILHWTLVLTVGIGCVIVMLMKGPAYVADPYALPDSERPAVSAGPSGAAGSLSGR